jgi:hypothetical protein
VHSGVDVAELHWADGAMDHTRLPNIEDDRFASVSEPFGICITFSSHLRCAVKVAGRITEYPDLRRLPG